MVSVRVVPAKSDDTASCTFCTFDPFDGRPTPCYRPAVAWYCRATKTFVSVRGRCEAHVDSVTHLPAGGWQRTDDRSVAEGFMAAAEVHRS